MAIELFKGHDSGLPRLVRWLMSLPGHRTRRIASETEHRITFSKKWKKITFSVHSFIHICMIFAFGYKHSFIQIQNIKSLLIILKWCVISHIWITGDIFAICRVPVDWITYGSVVVEYKTMFSEFYCRVRAEYDRFSCQPVISKRSDPSVVGSK